LEQEEGGSKIREVYAWMQRLNTIGRLITFYVLIWPQSITNVKQRHFTKSFHALPSTIKTIKSRIPPKDGVKFYIERRLYSGVKDFLKMRHAEGTEGGLREQREYNNCTR
jgi:hypothetical protein